MRRYTAIRKPSRYIPLSVEGDIGGDGKRRSAAKGRAAAVRSRVPISKGPARFSQVSGISENRHLGVNAVVVPVDRDAATSRAVAIVGYFESHNAALRTLLAGSY